MNNFKLYLKKKDFSEGTIQCAEKNLAVFFIWLKNYQLKPTSISYKDLLSFIDFCDKRGNKESSINIHLRYIRYYMEYLISTNQRTNNPAIHLHKRGTKQKVLFNLFSKEKLEEIYECFPIATITEKRNKIIVGMMVFQGLTTSEINKLTITDININRGLLNVSGSHKTNARTLKLEITQIGFLYDYLKSIRPELIHSINQKKDTVKLFINTGKSESLEHVMKYMLLQLQKNYIELTNFQKIRSSVIALWIDQFGERRAQYMAGHKYISSTERYKQTEIRELLQELDHWHPLNELLVKSK